VGNALGWIFTIDSREEDPYIVCEAEGDDPILQFAVLADDAAGLLRQRATTRRRRVEIRQTGVDQSP